MTTRKFAVSPVAQRDYRVLGGTKPSGTDAAARTALAKAQSSRLPSAVHVTQRKDGWAVKTEGHERASRIQPTKAQAVHSAREKASSQGARLIEHDSGGRISKNTKPIPKKK